MLLVGAGALKALRPDATARALHLPPWPIRTGAVAELCVGFLALTVGGPLLATLVSASFVGFATFVSVSLVRGTPLSTCGCFGEEDTPATVLHVVIDVALGAGAAIAATGRATPLGFPALAVAAVAAYLCYLALTELPRTLSAARR